MKPTKGKKPTTKGKKPTIKEKKPKITREIISGYNAPINKIIGLVSKMRRLNKEYDLKSIVLINIITQSIVDTDGFMNLMNIGDSDNMEALSRDVDDYKNIENKWFIETDNRYDDRECDRIGYVVDKLKRRKIPIADYVVLINIVSNYVIENKMELIDIQFDQDMNRI